MFLLYCSESQVAGKIKDIIIIHFAYFFMINIVVCKYHDNFISFYDIHDIEENKGAACLGGYLQRLKPERTGDSIKH